MACAGPAMTDPLTARQQEVAALVAGGLSNRAVAERLHLSVRTVESHVARALDTLGLADRAQLAASAHEAGLVAHNIPCTSSPEESKSPRIAGPEAFEGK